MEKRVTLMHTIENNIYISCLYKKPIPSSFAVTVLLGRVFKIRVNKGNGLRFVIKKLEVRCLELLQVGCRSSFIVFSHVTAVGNLF